MAVGAEKLPNRDCGSASGAKDVHNKIDEGPGYGRGLEVDAGRYQ